LGREDLFGAWLVLATSKGLFMSVVGFALTPHPASGTIAPEPPNTKCVLRIVTRRAALGYSYEQIFWVYGLAKRFIGREFWCLVMDGRWVFE